MSKIITDEQELNTSIEELVTENYALEVLGLKNPADFRKFSKSFMKLDKFLKEIEISSKKLATNSTTGIIKVGDNLVISSDGTLDILICDNEKLVALIEKYKGAGS